MTILTTAADPVRAPRSGEPPIWRTAMRTAVRDPVELCRLVKLPAEFERPAIAAHQLFPVFAPRAFVAKMRPGDPNDPLLRQVLPLADELVDKPVFSADPVGDRAAQVAPGLLQKYHGRALLVVTGTCPVHCRYCFRRHFSYAEVPRSFAEWEGAFEALEGDYTIHEAILSGGDPLTIGDSRLAALAGRIAQISHVRRLRIHTRLPIMIPERVTDALFAWLTGTRLTPIVVVHANHPNELDEPVAAAFGRLVESGVPVLNQTVLLRGVNDDAEILAELCERLADLRVMPYYLHQLDRVAGAPHFEVPVVRGLEIMEVLRSRLPGYAVPRYVREEAGARHKVVLTNAEVRNPNAE